MTAGGMRTHEWETERDGPLSESAWRAKLEGAGYRVSRQVYPPGMFFPDHSHGGDKFDAVLSGRFRITLGGQSTVLEAGQAVEVPRGAIHSAEVVGDEPVVSLDAERPADR